MPGLMQKSWVSSSFFNGTFSVLNLSRHHTRIEQYSSTAIIMMSANGNVVLECTDQIQRQGKERCKDRRSCSSKTADTSGLSMSTYDSEDDLQLKHEPDAELERNSSDMLVRMIAQEMLSSIMQGAANESVDDTSSKSSGPSGSGSNSATASTSSNMDLQALADLVMNSVANGFNSKKPDQDLRKMLREGLGTGDEMEFTETARESVRCLESSTSFANSSKTTSTRSGSTESDFSGLSMNEEKKQAPMDIWHPNFWVGEDANESKKQAATTKDTCSSPASENTYCADELATNGESIHSFVKKLGEVSSDTEGDDSSSVLSDITGFTGVFTDYPEERKTRSKKKVAPQAPSEADSNCPKKIAAKIPGKEKKNRVIAYSVSFTDVHVRVYERILSDNPACTSGPSIGIGWGYAPQDVRTVDDWEMERGRLRRPTELMLDRRQRKKLVKSLGYSDKDIAAAVRDLNKSRYQRRQTVNNLGALKMEEALEKTKRKVKKILFLQRNSKLNTDY